MKKLKILISIVLYSFIINNDLWATNQLVDSATNNQYTLTSQHNLLVVNARLTGTSWPDSKDAIICDNTAPGNNRLIGTSSSDIPAEIPNGSTGLAIVVNSNGSINAVGDKLAINANGAVSSASGTIFIYNRGSITRNISSNNNVISMGSSTGSMHLINPGTIVGDIIGSNNGDVIKMIDSSSSINGNIVGGYGGLNLISLTTNNNASSPHVTGFIQGSSLGNNVLNIGAIDFSNVVYCHLANVTDFQTINLHKTSSSALTTTFFTMKNPVLGVSNSVNISKGTAINIQPTSDLSGGGVINNAGNINLNGGSIGFAVAMGAVNNTGTITDSVSSGAGGNVVKIGALNNYSSGTINITKTNTKFLTGLDGSNVILNEGNLTISAGDLSSPIIRTSLINSGTFNFTGTATMMDYSPGAQLGEIKNTGTVNIASTNKLKISGNFNNNDSKQNNAVFVTPTLSIGNNSQLEVGNVYNNLGTINIEGDLSSVDANNLSILNNYNNQIINVISNGTIGSIVNPGNLDKRLGGINNRGTMNFSGGVVRTNIFINDNEDALLDISKSVNSANSLLVKDTIYNTFGRIIIGRDTSNPRGDISSLIVGEPSTLINSANQTITIRNLGTIGANGRLGTITNSGTINANGGNLSIGDFVNNNLNALLNITQNSVFVGNVNNLQGHILIEGAGDLSSWSSRLFSTLNNASNQMITIAGNATIGKINPLGAVNNLGVINAGGGNVNFGAFANNNEWAQLNLIKGTVTTGNITNTLGKINIGVLGSIENPDLSSPSNTNLSSLNNAINQVMTLSGSGTIGRTFPLGNVINNGIINAGGGNVTIGDFTNNMPKAELNIFSGLILTGNIDNKAGKINIIGNEIQAADLSSNGVGTRSSLINGIEQTINITGNGSLGATRTFDAIRNKGVFTAATSIGLRAGTFNNDIGGQVTITNINNATQVGGIAPRGIYFSSVENSGTFTINNKGQQDVNIGPITNNSGGVLNLNGFDANRLIIASGNFINNTNAIVNLNNVNLNLGSPQHLFTNLGTVNAETDVMILKGGYSLGSSATHKIIINNGIANKFTLHEGDCTIERGAKINLQIKGDRFLFMNGGRFNIFNISSVGAGIVNLANDTTVTEYNQLVNFRLERSSNTQIDLVVTRTPYTNVFGTNNPLNEDVNHVAAIGEIFDNFVRNNVNGDLLTGIANLEKLPSIEVVKDTAEQFLPEFNYVSRSGFEAPSIIFDAAQVKLDKTARLDLQNFKPSLTGYSAGTILSDDIIWIKAIGSSAVQKQLNAFLGYNSNGYGTVLGMDSKVTNNSWLGFAGSFITSQVKTKDSPAKLTNIFSYQSTIYGTYSKENYYIDAFAGIALNNYKTRRMIVFPGFDRQAKAQFIGLQPSFKASVGHIKQIDGFRLIPNLSWQYSLLRQRAYTESGAGNASLRVEHADLKQIEGSIGIKIGMVNKTDTFVFNPEFHFNFSHNFKHQTQETIAEFTAGGGKFKLAGFVPSKDTYNIGAALTFIKDQDVHFTMNYELKMKNKFVNHFGSLAIRYEL